MMWLSKTMCQFKSFMTLNKPRTHMHLLHENERAVAVSLLIASSELFQWAHSYNPICSPLQIAVYFNTL